RSVLRLAGRSARCRGRKLAGRTSARLGRDRGAIDRPRHRGPRDLVAVSPPRRTPTRALALGAVVAVLGLAISGRPSITIYDGLIIPPPYLWLQPGPGQPGNPPSAMTTLPVSGGSSPLLALATSEDVPQAQVFAIPGGLELPAG